MSNSIDIPYLTLEKIASTFLKQKCQINIKKINRGLINNTYLVTPDIFSSQKYFILQLLNIDVFHNPENIISNYLLLEKSYYSKKKNSVRTNYDHCKLPKLIANIETGQYFYKEGNIFARALEYLDNTKTFDMLPSAALSEEVFKCLARFHFFSSDTELISMHKILDNFHCTPYVYKQFELELKSFLNSSNLSKRDYTKFFKLVDYATNNKDEAFLLKEPKSNNQIFRSAIHGDPKVNNFLFNFNSNQVISLIDLDTFQEGYVLDDIADCLRSCCNTAGEEPISISKVNFDLQYFDLSLSGYFSNKNNLLGNIDMFYLPLNIRSITFELGLRFLTDFMRDNIYFNINYPNQNLYRAEVQFSLLSSIKSQWDAIMKITKGISL